MSQRPDGESGHPDRDPADPEALSVLRSIWTATRQSGVDLEHARPKGKVCRNMKNIGFGGLATPDPEDGSTAVPVDEDMRSAWREQLASEGKLRPGATSVFDLVKGVTGGA